MGFRERLLNLRAGVERDANEESESAPEERPQRRGNTSRRRKSGVISAFRLAHRRTLALRD
jgi:hypothetical protein